MRVLYPWVEVFQLLLISMAYIEKNYDKANYRVYYLIGDGESAKGTAQEDAALLNLRLIRHGTAYIFNQLRNDELDVWIVISHEAIFGG
ncbi:hypothetical protein KQX54_011724 [Cotesia glomerata]|uniref:Alkaline phosphatase n=1 Tax=Cotesia glomerata TaxID=32391 RepID=A0AAV7IEM8_COTGL|nr:hypothetical protein KQX54_011724 [Cotesia glomerata]